jgi:hypothetical protein
VKTGQEYPQCLFYHFHMEIFWRGDT